MLTGICIKTQLSVKCIEVRRIYVTNGIDTIDDNIQLLELWNCTRALISRSTTEVWEMPSGKEKSLPTPPSGREWATS